jgi:fatty acid desaturase
MAAPATSSTSRRAPRTLDAGDLRRLRRVRPWRAAVSIAVAWASIAVPAAAAIAWGHWLGFVLAIAWIGFRQIALFNVMHDGVHDLLHPARRWNDLLGDLCAAWPLATTTARYRAAHLPHHRFLSSARDPDLVVILQRQLPGRLWPASRREAFALLGRDLCGMNFVRNLVVARRRSLYTLVASQDLPVPAEAAEPAAGPTTRPLVALLAVAAAGVVLLAAAGWLGTALTWFGLALLLWVVPLTTAFQVAMRLHQWGDHLGLEPTAGIAGTRNVYVDLAERVLISPNHSNYHLAHHLYPQVPNYNLRALHQRLSEDDDYVAQAPRADGYVLGRRAVLSRLVTAPEDVHQRTLAAGRGA